MRDAFDAHRRDGRAFDRTQQHAAQSVADGGAETALERLRREHAVPVRQRLGIGNQPLGFLKTFKHNLDPRFTALTSGAEPVILCASVTSSASEVRYFEYSSTMSCSFN